MKIKRSSSQHEKHAMAQLCQAHVNAAAKVRHSNLRAFQDACSGKGEGWNYSCYCCNGHIITTFIGFLKTQNPNGQGQGGTTRQFYTHAFVAARARPSTCVCVWFRSQPVTKKICLYLAVTNQLMYNET
eukprot:5715744-Amphidinium_carterae.1